ADVHGLALQPSKGQFLYQALTRTSAAERLLSIGSSLLNLVLLENPQVFELKQDVVLYAEHNRISFYTWGARQCCLPKGATSAWLLGSLPNLHCGNVLIFAEVLGPNSGTPEDADPAHRHAVRLTRVTPAEDPLGGSLTSPLSTVALTSIEWSQEDALPFSLCLSSLSGTEFFPNV